MSYASRELAVLDHIGSNNLFASPFAYDPVHVNAEFFDQLSDHDPQVARFFVNTAPTADAGGPYPVAEVLCRAVGGRATRDASPTRIRQQRSLRPPDSRRPAAGDGPATDGTRAGRDGRRRR
jgi:hypothetical protein